MAAEIQALAFGAILISIMLPWPLQFVALGLLALVWVAQWLD